MPLYYNCRMLHIDIPGKASMAIEHAVCDFNGTLALDGTLDLNLIPAVEQLSQVLTLHVVSADTFGSVLQQLSGLPVTTQVLEPGNEAQQKGSYVRHLGRGSVIAIGQGTNDAGMLREAALGIGVLSSEGIARDALLAADILVPCAADALALLLHPKRLTATLRS